MDSYRRTPTSPASRHRGTDREHMPLRERVRRWFGLRAAWDESEVPWFLDGIIVLSPEGSAEVLEEIRNGSPDTPERLAMFARMQRRAEIRKRLAAEPDTAKLG